MLAITWIALLIYAYPGQMTWDSFEAMREVRDGIYTDGAPPMWKAVWSVTEQFAAGPIGMFAVQSIAFVVGLHGVLRRAFGPRGAAWAAAGVLAFPPVLIPVGVIWEHSLMAGALMLGTAGLLAADRRLRVAALGALALAGSVRYGAHFATLPLVIALFEWRPARAVHRYSLAAAAWIAITLAGWGANRVLTDVPMDRWTTTVAVHDIVGTLAFLDDDLPDAELARVLAGTDLRVTTAIHARARQLHSPRDFIGIIHDKRGMWRLPLYGRIAAPAAQREAIGRARWQLVTTYPVAYLKHRLSVWGQTIGYSKQLPSAVVSRELPHYEVALAAGVPTRSSETQDALTDALDVLATTTPIFRPWIYLVVALVLLGFARRQRDVLALLASGLLLELSLFFTTPAAEHRHSHWFIVTVCVALVLVVVRRVRP